MWFTKAIFHPVLGRARGIVWEERESGDKFKLAILRIHNPSIQHGVLVIYSNSPLMALQPH